MDRLPEHEEDRLLDPEHWSKAERLAVAGMVAPALREGSVRARARRVFVTDKDGEIKKVVSLKEVQEGLLSTAKIELAVEDGIRPKEVICRGCKGIIKVEPRGHIPIWCKRCPQCICGKKVRHAGQQCRKCCRPPREAAFCACGRPLHKEALKASAVNRRKGKPAVCDSCSRARLKKAKKRCACGSELSRSRSKKCRACVRTPRRLCACGKELSKSAKHFCTDCHSKQMFAFQSAKICVGCGVRVTQSAKAKRAGAPPRCRNCWLSSVTKGPK